MKRLLLLFVVVCFAFAQSVAQEPTFIKGDKVLNLGIGVGTNIYSGSYNRIIIPPFSASLEIGVEDELIDKGAIGVGPYLGFTSYKWDYNDHTATYINTILGARGNFHYPLVEKLDTYAGFLLGYNFVSRTETVNPIEDHDYSSSHLAWALFIGARYYFKENIAVMAELGYGVAILNVGLALKF
ncbi:MAG: hypothetical protein NTY95_13945 [Bacteroidia bacterium]|nr:hypothetical protein [Bacteroidia bacterium]